MVIGYTGYGKGTIAIPFSEAIHTFQLKNDPKLCSMPLYDIRGELYKYTLYETFDYTITRYKRNSVFNTLQHTHTKISTIP